jgi:hypothetical protein
MLFASVPLKYQGALKLPVLSIPGALPAALRCVEGAELAVSRHHAFARRQIASTSPGRINPKAL